MFGLPYKITNRVVEFEADRRIAWRDFGGHRWRYGFSPTADGGTVVYRDVRLFALQPGVDQVHRGDGLPGAQPRRHPRDAGAPRGRRRGRPGPAAGRGVVERGRAARSRAASHRAVTPRRHDVVAEEACTRGGRRPGRRTRHRPVIDPVFGPGSRRCGPTSSARCAAVRRPPGLRPAARPAHGAGPSGASPTGPRTCKALDERRLVTPDWFQRPDQLGYVCYTDRFSGTLRELPRRIGYLRELGVTYLHLMPLLQPRDGPRRRRLRRCWTTAASIHGWAPPRQLRDAGRRAAVRGRQPGARPGLQPHRPRARAGRSGRGAAIRRTPPTT